MRDLVRLNLSAGVVAGEESHGAHHGAEEERHGGAAEVELLGGRGEDSDQVSNHEVREEHGRRAQAEAERGEARPRKVARTLQGHDVGLQQRARQAERLRTPRPGPAHHEAAHRQRRDRHADQHRHHVHGVEPVVVHVAEGDDAEKAGQAARKDLQGADPAGEVVLPRGQEGGDHGLGRGVGHCLPQHPDGAGREVQGHVCRVACDFGDVDASPCNANASNEERRMPPSPGHGGEAVAEQAEEGVEAEAEAVDELLLPHEDRLRGGR
mmetsp:Transcript_126241/g.393002  ORF Transcript_126241/g.393002 Transcript_126241/m.393002 type:complete len:267 (+) Transcript_126241:504-1304(+)